MQLTNILRDVKDDAKRGRIYLPLDDMKRFGVSEQDILTSNYTQNFVHLMRYECQRATEYFDLARNALKDEDKHYFMAARIMWSIYAHTLKRIERSNYNVFKQRISIPKPLKLLIAFRYWLSHQLQYAHEPRTARHALSLIGF